MAHGHGEWNHRTSRQQPQLMHEPHQQRLDHLARFVLEVGVARLEHRTCAPRRQPFARHLQCYAIIEQTDQTRAAGAARPRRCGELSIT